MIRTHLFKEKIDILHMYEKYILYLIEYGQLPGIPSFRKLTIDLQLTYFIVCEF